MILVRVLSLHNFSRLVLFTYMFFLRSPPFLGFRVDVSACSRGGGEGVRARPRPLPPGLRQGALPRVHSEAVPPQEKNEGSQTPPVAELRHAPMPEEALRLGDVLDLPGGETQQADPLTQQKTFG